MNKNFWVDSSSEDYFDIEGETSLSILHPKLLEISGSLHGKRVLDFGCGGGLLSAKLAKAGAEVFGVDISPSGLASAKKKYSEKYAIQFMQIDPDDYTKIRCYAPFDIAILSLVLGNLTSQSALQTIQNIRNILGNHAKLLIADSHPCFRHYSYSTCVQKMPIEQYRKENRPYQVEIYDAYIPDKVSHFTNYHHTLASRASMLCQAGFLIKNLHEIYDETNEGCHKIVQSNLNDKVPAFLVTEAINMHT